MKPKELLTASIFYLLLTLVFFHKIFFNLIPLPTDLIVGGYYPWINYEKGSGAGVPVKNPKLSDAVSIFYPLKSLAADQVNKGEIPLWNPHIFGGYPLYTSPTLGLLFPTSVFYLFFHSSIAWTLQTMTQPFLASLFMYLLLRHLKLPKLASLFGGTVYGFGGFTILWLQWNGQSTTSIFLPILILLEDKYLSTKKNKWGVLLAIFICLQILSGYLPIISLTFVCLAAWYIYFSKNIFKDLKIAPFILLGIGLSAFFLLPLAELVTTSQRVSETLSTENPFILPQNLVNLIAPDFFGNDATYNFWGQGDHMDSTLYAGIVTIVLALIGLTKMHKKRHVKFALLLLLITTVIAFKNPIGSLLYNLGLWGGSSITMNRVNFITNFVFAILASFGIASVKKSYKFSLKPAFIVLFTLLSLAFGILIYKLTLLSSPNLNTLLDFSDQGNPSLIHSNVALRNLVWPTLLALGVLTAQIFFKKVKSLATLTGATFILILIIDLFRLGWKFNTFSSPAYIYPQTPISDFLKNYPNDRFVAEKDIFPANMWVPFRLSSIAGYDSVYPLNTAKLIAVANSGNIHAKPQPRWAILSNFSSRILDATNTRFLVALKKEPYGKVSTKGQVTGIDKLTKYHQVFEDKEIVILENKKSLSRTYMTNKVIKTSDEQTLTLLLDEEFPINKVAITQDFEFNPQSDLPLVYTSNYYPVTNSHIVVNTSSNQDTYLVVLDSFYPGWKVLVDNKESTIYRTNYNFRGVLLNKGKHTVEFIYAPKLLNYGLAITGLSLLITLLILRKGSKINQ